MKFFISAAEVSSDLHGAALFEKLKLEAADRGLEVKAFGIGGAELSRVGLEGLLPASDFLVMGLVEVLGRVFKMRRAREVLLREVRLRKPDALILLDYPSFHFWFLKKLLKQWSETEKVPVFYYIPPKVWASRVRRTEFMAQALTHTYCLFPFEESFLRDRGVRASYFGNPLADELPLELSREEARRRLGLSNDGDAGRTVLLMPGSRPSEIRRHFPIVLESARLAREKIDRHCPEKKWTLLIPLSETVDPQVWFEVFRAPIENMRSLGFELKLLRGQSHLAMLASDGGLIKSGTSTLEAAVLGCPHAVLYQLNPITVFFYRKILGYRGPASLVNFFEGGPEKTRWVVPEFLARECRPDLLASSLVQILEQGSFRAQMVEAFKRIRGAVLGGGDRGESPSLKIAKDILDHLKSRSP